MLFQTLLGPLARKLLLYGAICLVNGVLGWLILRRRKVAVPGDAKSLAWLGFVLPFASGGFYSFAAVPVGIYLVWYIASAFKRNGQLTFRWNLSTVAILLLPLAYACSVAWAADKGMAPFGFVHTFPLLLYVLALLQVAPEERDSVYALLPWGAGEMVLLSFLMGRIPGLQDMVLVNQRLAGFFEYPNTFAVFLIAALVLVCTQQNRSWREYTLCALLIFGVLESGSRGAMLLLVAVLAAIGIVSRSGKRALLLFCCLTAAAGLYAVLTYFLSGGEHYDPAAAGSSTLLGRILYAKDLLPVILKHPFGVGYMGYYALQGSFQHGVYSVAYVHNELLQLLIDVGWLPAGLCAAAGIHGIFSRAASMRQRMLLAVLLGHALVDFDLQFLAIWLLLLPALQIDGGKCCRLRRTGTMSVTLLASCFLAVSLWLSTGDLLFLTGNAQAALRVTPFYTRALEKQLTTLDDAEQLNAVADRLLVCSPYSALGHDAKANAAYASGNIRAMMQEKESAIACSRYTLAEYGDYFQKLYTAMLFYWQSGDDASAQVCREKLLAIPDMLEEVRRSTDPLGWKIADQPQLTLPEEYLDILEKLRRG